MINDFGYVSLEHLLLSWCPSQPTRLSSGGLIKIDISRVPPPPRIDKWLQERGSGSNKGAVIYPTKYLALFSALYHSIGGHQFGEIISSSASLYRGTSLIRNTPPPLGSQQGPRNRPTVGSYGEAVSYERGTPVFPLANLDQPWLFSAPGLNCELNMSA